MSKSRYDIQFNMNQQDAYNLILQWLQVNGFQMLQDENGVYYEYNDMLVGRKCLEFQINGNIATFFAYMGSRKKPMELEGFVGALPKQAYVGELQELFLALQGKNMQMQQPYQQNMQYNQTPQYEQYEQYGQQGQYGQQMSYGQNVQYSNQQQPITNMTQFSNNLDKKNGGFAIASLCMGIFSLLAACCSGGQITVGGYLSVLGIFFGISGLKSSKKVMGIIGIVTNALSVVALIAMLVITLAS